MSEMRPDRLERMVADIERLFADYPDKRIPFNECLVPTHDFFLDLCKRVLALEEGVRGE